MSEEEKQAATEATDEQAKPATEETGAPEKTKEDDLDTALKEFEEQTAAGSTEAKPKADDAATARLERLERELNERNFREDFGKVVSNVRGDFAPDEVDDAFIGLWIEAEAKKDERVAQAWIKRYDEPTKFARVVEGLAQKFAKKHSKLRRVDEGASADREAVTASLRGQSKAQEGKAPELSKLTDREARETIEKTYGYTPSF